MSPPFSPAARTRTRTSPAPGSGSRWSRISIRPSSIVTARMRRGSYARRVSAHLPSPNRVTRTPTNVLTAGPEGRVGSDRDDGSFTFCPAPHLEGGQAGPGGRRTAAGPDLPRRWGPGRRRSARHADPRLPRRRRLPWPDDALAPPHRPSHAQGRDALQRGLLGGRHGGTRGATRDE